MKKNILLGIAFVVLCSCVSAQKDVKTAPYTSAAPIGQNALVYGLPQTRLYFEVELIKTIIKKGPYADYANRMLGLQNVPMKDSETWQLRSIRINEKQEVDNKQLYTVTYTDYPYNVDRLFRLTNQGLLMDISANNILTESRRMSNNTEDIQFVNTAIRATTTEKVDTFYKTVVNDTAFIRIPVLQRKVLGKTVEEQAREAAAQIFYIRQSRLDVLTGNVDHPADGTALKLVLDALNQQEEQLLSLFNGARVENRYVYTYSALPEKTASTSALFYFSDRAGIVAKNTAGAKEVWYEIGEVTVPPSISPGQQAANLIYYRIPQIVEISAGVGKDVMANGQKAIYQLGNLVSLPLVAPKK